MPMKDLIFLSNYIKMEYGEKRNLYIPRPKTTKEVGREAFCGKNVNKKEKNQLGGNKHYG